MNNLTKFSAAVALTLTSCMAAAQTRTDTVIVPLARTSQVIFTIGDPDDLEVLRHYNFQALFDDILKRVAEGDTLVIRERDEHEPEPEIVREEPAEENWSNDDDENDDDDSDHHSHKHHRRRSYRSFNMDLGINNYVENEKFPGSDKLYAVRPWGSWYVGFNSVQRTRVASILYFESAIGVSWYNFKFEDDNILVGRDDNGVTFTEDMRSVDHIKSKLSATFVNVSFVPVFDFGNDSGRRSRVWDGDDSFRLGFGVYGGYRISSKYKHVYEDDHGDRRREKDRDSFNLHNLRYGFRAQVGFGSADFFVNYDMNNLFQDDKGPALNAVSFGIIL